jgi:hypothetical protein
MTDEKAAERYWATHALDAPTKDAFLAGCQHVRQSQRYLALEKVAEAAKRLNAAMENPEMPLSKLDCELANALAALDRASGEGK